MFFPSKLSVLFSIGLVSAPAVATARPDAARDGALTDHVRKTHGNEGKRADDRDAPQSKRMGGLCQMLACTAEQSEAIRTIRHETRMRLKAERTEGHERVEVERILAGALGRIGAVLDEGQREELTRLVAAHGPKIAFGGGLTAKRERTPEERVDAAHERVDAAEKRLAKAKSRLAKLERRADDDRGDEGIERAAKRDGAKAKKAKGKGNPRRFAAKARHSAKA